MRTLFVAIVTVFATVATLAQDHEQEINVGASLSLPLFDTSDSNSLGFVIEGNYLYEVVEDIEVGGSIGYMHNFGKSVDVVRDTGIEDTNTDAIGFLPIAATARYEIGNDIEVGLDLGYAFKVTGNLDGGFYFAPRAQYGVWEDVDAVVSFKGITSNLTVSVLSIGLEYEF